TRTQFVTVSHQPARGRLILSPAADGKLNVENGFEWNIRAVIAADADGNLYAGGELPAGASTRIGQTGTGTGQSDELAAALKLLREQRLEMPPNFSGSDYSSYSYRSRMYMY